MLLLFRILQLFCGMFRFVLIILIFLPTFLFAQGKPTTSPPPPPPPPPKNVGSGSGPTGMQVITIPVNGRFKLGMLRSEFDSAMKKEIPAIQTSTKPYPVKAEAYFRSDRLYTLQLTLIRQNDPKAHEDIIKTFEERYGEPTSRKQDDRKVMFPVERDSTLSGEHLVKELQLTWKLKKYEIRVYSEMIEIQKDIWKDRLLVTYTGDQEFMLMLQQLEKGGGY